jgi:hypothetical protein
VGEIDLVAILADAEERREKTRAAPLHLRGADDEEGGAEAEDGHVEAGAAEPACVGLPGKDETGGDDR